MLLLILLVLLIFILIFCLIQHNYKKFVIQNSSRLHMLIQLNSKYHFFKLDSLDQSHVYDNENMFHDISCADYLTYQFQYIRNNAIDQIKLNKQNNNLFIKYSKEKDYILTTEDSLPPTNKHKQKKALKIERRLLKKHTLPTPRLDFNIKVSLFCSTINGRIYARKSENFSAEKILFLIKRLDNKNGTFYNDREIWESLCRVERGKVSNKMRFSIYKRDNYRCCKCGISSKYAQLEIDHIIPIAKGGKSSYDNLQTLCHKCNAEKGDKYDI